MKIRGVNNRIVFAVANAALFAVFEVFLVPTPAFAWVYPWWDAIPVFITVYIPFSLAAFYCYDWSPPVQRRFIGAVFAVDALLLILCAAILGWI